MRLVSLIAGLLMGAGFSPAAEPVYGVPPGECESTVITTAFLAMPADWSTTYCKLAEVTAKATGKGVRVCILDTGCDVDHRDLTGHVKESKDYTNSRSGFVDVNGHGTHCAGIVRRWAPAATLGNYKVLGDSGSGSSSGIARAIRDAADAGFHVLSLSLGGPSPDSATESAVKYATAKGVIVVVAAGNSGPRDGTVGWPGAFPESIAIASIQSDGNVANYSSRGREVFIAAPGSSIVSTYPGNRYATLSGTSMATPMVAGVAASWLEASGNVGKPDAERLFRAALQKHAKDIPPTGRDTGSGFGLAWPLAMVSESGPTPEPTPGGSIAIDLSDLSTTARDRILKSDPTFKSVTITRGK